MDKCIVKKPKISIETTTNLVSTLTQNRQKLKEKCFNFLTPEPNGVGEGVLGIGRVLCLRRRRRDTVSVWTP